MMRNLLAAMFWMAAAMVARAEERTYDVVVFGATPAGVAAAVGAAREGASVALVEPQDIVGGIMSSGLSFSDSNQTDRRVLRGLFEEVHQRIEDHYKQQGIELPYQVAVKNQDTWTYEPHVAERVFNDLLAEAGVQVFLDQRLRDVQKSGDRLTSFTTESGDTFRAKTFVDATYEGDLMAAAGVAWTIGRESRAEYGESLAGRQFPKPVVEGVDPYDDQGNLLPLMTAESAGDVEAGDRRVMVYSFRLCLTSDPANRVPLAKPANYDPAQFELVRRFVKVHPPKRLLMDLYPLPGDKLDGNNGIGHQISLGLVGASSEWCEASYAEREKIWQAHRDYTEGLLWFMAHDAAMPAALRDEMQGLGYCRDEFARWGHFPPVLYVREGRRMRSEYVLTQGDVLDEVEKPDAIAVGSFPVDSHDVQRVATGMGGFIDEGTIFPKPQRLPGRRMGRPYQIPYRAITPRRGECDNLLVPVALSCSHVAYSSIRVEPTWIVIGQSAGIAAAIAAKSDASVQDLDYAKLRERLIAQKQALDLLPLP